MLFRSRQFLPKEAQGALLFGDFIEMLNANQYSQAIVPLKSILTIFPEMAYVVSLCSDWINDKLNPMKEQNHEFEQLGDAIKVKARELILQEQYDAAKQILLSLQQLLPEDKEIKTMLSIL